MDEFSAGMLAKAASTDRLAGALLPFHRPNCCSVPWNGVYPAFETGGSVAHLENVSPERKGGLMFTFAAIFGTVRRAALTATFGLGLAGMSSVGQAANITIHPGQALELRFTTLPSPDCTAGGGACDTLIFDLGFTANTANITTAQLFDSSTLLGTYKTDAACLMAGTCPGLVPAFVTATSLYKDSAPVIDFTSILNGTIDGVLDISFDNSITFDPTSSFNFFGVMHGTSSSSAAGGYFRGYDSASIVSEPESLSTLLAGTAVLIGLVARHRRTKGGQANLRSPDRPPDPLYMCDYMS